MKSLFIRFWRVFKRLFIILFIAQLAYIVALKWVDPPITITQLVSLISGEGLKRDYIRWEDISPNARLAVMAHEDQLFAVHNGFDWESISKAMSYNKKKPRSVRGGSTISQQVAKNVFLWQGRSYLRKGLEAYFTFMIELVWGKKRILQMYLNVSEMGRGIYGIEAASQAYFMKPAKKTWRYGGCYDCLMFAKPKKIQGKTSVKLYPATFGLGSTTDGLSARRSGHQIASEIGLDLL